MTPAGVANPTPSGKYTDTVVQLGEQAGSPDTTSDFHYDDVTLTNGGCPSPSVIFTSNGRPISSAIPAPANANDFEIYWRPGHCYQGYQIPPVAVVFTYHGQYVSGDPPLAPCKAVDFRVVWQPSTVDNQIRSVCWTNANGLCVKNSPVALPIGGLTSSDSGGPAVAPYIDDVCIELSYGNKGTGKPRILRAVWTRDGKALKPPIIVPASKRGSANDVCWYGYSASGGSSGH